MATTHKNPDVTLYLYGVKVKKKNKRKFCEEKDIRKKLDSRHECKLRDSGKTYTINRDYFEL